MTSPADANRLAGMGRACEPGHRYLPLGDADLREMLAAVGVDAVDRLFDSLPASIRLTEPLAVDGPLSDQELRALLHRLEERNRVAGRELSSFLGGGAYRHELPAVTDYLVTRAEFLTVYTPYQPEVSQGTLQAIFEFQTLISLLTGLPVANASLYEGASAMAEAVLMAARIKKARQKVVVARSVHPHYRQTLASYVKNLDVEIVEVGWDSTGRVDQAALAAALDENTMAVVAQSPNYFGAVESWSALSEAAHAAGALSIGTVSEALSLALLASPGDGGCDIAAGEAQSFGLPLSYGGPYLGLLAAREEFKRAMPGRLAGQTVDSEERRAFVLTLATREQHIRREKATSNICTNQALCALMATVYLALHGKHGLRRLAEINLQRAAAVRRLLGTAGLASRFEAPSFNEAAYRCPTGMPAEELLAGLEAEGVLGGIPLGPDYPELADSFLVAVTETNQPAELERFAAEVRRILAGGKAR